MQLTTQIALDTILLMGNTQYESGLSVAPNMGRVDIDAEMKIYVREVSTTWVHVMASADLEKTIWSQEAKDIVLSELGIPA